MIDRSLINQIGVLFLQETQNDRGSALELFQYIAKQVGVSASNLLSLKSNEDAQLIICGFYEYKKEMTRIESAPLTPEEEAFFT